ncbi:MAG: hypothetical protein Q9162_007472 [Coniocarpon cinnabarinum]
MNITGSGTKTLETYAFDDPSNQSVAEAPNAVTYIANDFVINYPGGASYSLDIGAFSLFSPGGVDSYNLTNGSEIEVTTMIESTLRAGWIGHPSFSLHLGSSSPVKIPPSLVLGGYDPSHVLSDVVQIPLYKAALLDIQIGISSGISPIAGITPEKPASGLLAGNSTSRVSQNIELDGRLPYMYLPAVTCDAIAQKLPITYDAELALYIWNTSDPAYNDIVSSPTYLSFVFNEGNSIANATIKVPFALLNLTLLPPLVDAPTIYFPCRPTGALDLKPLDSYWLGRAFMQQAFLGSDWLSNRLWIGQAPGPNIPATSSDLGILGVPLQTSKTRWEDTWEGHLVPLTTTPSYLSPRVYTPANSSSDFSSAPSSGLSTGARAGIGVGAAVAALLIALGALLLFRHRRQRKDKDDASAFTYSQRKELDANDTFTKAWAQDTFKESRPEIEKVPHELGSQNQMSELPGSRPHPVELQ